MTQITTETSSRSIKRVYHPHWLWEEVAHNMWGSVKEKDWYLEIAIEFTGDAEIYGEYMMRVVKEWKYSCEHNLSNRSQNRKAWVGHAACALALQCPEDIVRQAWGHLTEQQQIEANAAADRAIAHWEEMYAKEKIGNECPGSRQAADQLDV